MIRYESRCQGVTFANCSTDTDAAETVVLHRPECPAWPAGADGPIVWEPFDEAEGPLRGWFATVDGQPVGHSVVAQLAPDLSSHDPADNPYWAEVVAWARRNPVGQMVLDWRYAAMQLPFPDAADVPSNMFIDAMQQRETLVRKYAWTITSPDVVTFVAGWLGAAAIDPFAGNGYWAHLLTRFGGLDVSASDLEPRTDPFVPVAQADAVAAVRAAQGSGRRLLLGWPPLWQPVGADVLDVYDGDRVVYIGGEDRSNCGDARMWDVLDERWRKVALLFPPSWPGAHDQVVVYERSRHG